MKRIEQVSVFLENKSGRLNEILDILSTADVRIIASSVADTSEFGILRMITSDTATAVATLKEAKVSANISEVLAVKCENSAAAYAKEVAKLANGGIHIEYMYSYSSGCESTIILRTNDNKRALEVAEANNFNILTQSDLIKQ